MQTFSFFCIVFSLIGVWLNIKKRKSCFIIWTVTNASWAIIDFYKELYWQSLLFTIYFGLAIYGLYNWSKDK